MFIDDDFGIEKKRKKVTKNPNKGKKSKVRCKNSLVSYNPASTYILLKDGTYYEIKKGDHERLTDKQIVAYFAVKYNISGIKIIRPIKEA
jgi:alpha-tubulin suppressor-like RCC1 family protein